MHELALAQAVAEQVDNRAGGRPVRRVEVRIGYLRQVVPDALAFSWEMLTEGTDLESAKLVIEHIPATVLCKACGIESTLDWPVLACATCESHDVELLTGDELELAWIDVAEAVT